MNDTLPELQADTSENKALKTTRRIGAGMFIVSAVHGIISSIIFLMINGRESLSISTIVFSIFNLIIGVGLWQASEQAIQYAIPWCVVLVFYSIYDLVSGNSYAFILDIAFSGSLILLLAGKPSKVRMITSAFIYIVVYLGLLCLGFTSYFILGVR